MIKSSKSNLTQIDKLTIRFLVDVLSISEMENRAGPLFNSVYKESKINHLKAKYALGIYSDAQNISKIKFNKISNTKLVDLYKKTIVASSCSVNVAKALQGFMSFNNSTFIYLYSRYDAYMEDILRCLYSRSNIMLKSDQQLKYSDIVDLEPKTFLSVKNKFIDEEIEKLRFSRYNTFLSIEKHCYVKPLESNKLKDFIIESSERRNIIVHHNGKITSQYKEILKRNGIPLTTSKRITIDTKYLNNAFASLILIATELSMSFHKSNARKQIIISKIIEDVLVGFIGINQHESAMNIIKVLKENADAKNLGICLVYEALYFKLIGDDIELKKVMNILEDINNNNIKISIYMLDNNITGATRFYNKLTKKARLSVDIYITQMNHLLFSDFIKSGKYIPESIDKIKSV